MFRTSYRRVIPVMFVLGACGDDGPSGPPDVYFELDSAADTDETFWDQPFPTDLRVHADGTLDLTGYPTRDSPLVDDMLAGAMRKVGGPLMPITYVRFGVEVPDRRRADVIPASLDEAVFLVDIDPDSPGYGTLYPLVCETLAVDDFSPATLVSVAPRPGVVLAPATTYAVVFRAAFAPEASAPPDFVALRDGDSDRADAVAAYAPLWPALEDLGVALDDVLVATVITTGDEAARMYARSELVRTAHDAVIADLAIDPVDGAVHDGYCELLGTITYPQFQTGTPPFRNDGIFEYDEDGAPVAQREATVPFRITLPFGEMPAAGWPLFQYVHGSGGFSTELMDRGPTLEIGGEWTVGEGPALVIARHGIAGATSAMPLNPERHVGASDYEYLNINNLSALPFTFQQGVFEQRLMTDALLALAIDPGIVCAEVTLPAGETAHHFDPDTLTLGGQSMGGMYTNMIGTVDPRFGALVPMGAGGFWNLMVLETAIVPGARELLVAALSTNSERLNFMHPALNLLAVGWEIAEPMTYMSRVARRPLPGFASKSVYESAGLNDNYFPTSVYDAAALSYGNQQAGDDVWDGMQDVLALEDRDGMAAYPVSANRTFGESPTTNVVVQYADDGILSGHKIAFQLDEVKHQYGCFLATYVATGTPVVPAPGDVGDPCD